MAGKSKETTMLHPPKLPITIDFLDVINVGIDCDWRSRTGIINPPVKENPAKAITIIKDYCKIEYEFIEKVRDIKNNEDWMKIKLIYSSNYKPNILH